MEDMVYLNFGQSGTSIYSDTVHVSRTIEAEDINATELANFFSSCAKAVGFNVSGVSIWMGDTEHPSDY